MLEAIITSTFASIAAISIVAFLARAWIEAHLKSSLEHEYKKQFELFQRQLDRKKKIELVAELLDEYIKIPTGETVPYEHRHLKNKLSFQAALWLPSGLAIQLSKRLQNKPDARNAL